MPPSPCQAANPQELSDFDLPVYVAGAAVVSRTGRFPALIRVAREVVSDVPMTRTFTGHLLSTVSVSTRRALS